jgi:hypothetical protein
VSDGNMFDLQRLKPVFSLWATKTQYLWTLFSSMPESVNCQCGRIAKNYCLQN